MLKLKKHESFHIREGWLEKGINIIHDNPKCFYKDTGSEYFGLGTNMVKSLKYWLNACNIAEFKSDAMLTEFGKMLYQFDKYLEDDFSWWMIHYYLVTNTDLAIVMNEFFNMEYTKIEKEVLFNYLKDKYTDQISSESSLESDITILFRTYYGEDKTNPEQNLNSPFVKLGLLNYSDKKYIKSTPKISKLNYLIIFYNIEKLIEKIGNINEYHNLEDILKLDNNPLRIFNISKSMLMIYIDEMKQNGLVTIIKTAGLNTFKIEKNLNLEEIFTKYFTK